MNTISIETFESTYKPMLAAATADDAPYCGWMLETYGDEYKKVQTHPPDKIWTLVDCDGELILTNGWHFVNRMGYVLTENAFNPDDEIQVEDK